MKQAKELSPISTVILAKVNQNGTGKNPIDGFIKERFKQTEEIANEKQPIQVHDR